MYMWLYTENDVTPAATVASKYGDCLTRGPMEIENWDMIRSCGSQHYGDERTSEARPRFVPADRWSHWRAPTRTEMSSRGWTGPIFFPSMTSHRFPNLGDLIAANSEYAAGFQDADLNAAPTRHLAVVACMDARLDVSGLLGLASGEAHVMRNAGGVVTDDVIRSLCLSQRSLGTKEIVLIHHTDCGLQKTDASDFIEALEAETGIKPAWAVEAFADPHRDVVQSANRLRASPFLAEKQHISGFVYDVETGLLDPVDLPRHQP